MTQTSAALAIPVPRSGREEHTFRGNSTETRHGWLRLTPAYSVRLVDSLLKSEPGVAGPVLDPFCGTGTTLLSCTERGVDGDTVDINPFLIWLARAKLHAYTNADRKRADAAMGVLCRAALEPRTEHLWTPPLFQIEKWWSRATLEALARVNAALERLAASETAATLDLLRLAFCQALIERSRASFGHQSMSFEAQGTDEESPGDAAEREAVAEQLRGALSRLLAAASVALPQTRRRVLWLDARRLHEELPRGYYGSVITSPPYANRMSYIRELRPYMYWLRYLHDRTSAGALDWRTIGGTWGAATSNLGSWSPAPDAPAPDAALTAQLDTIAEQSPILANYVRKYFHDMRAHLESLATVLRPGGRAFFVVGNSKFYDVVVPVQDVLARQFESVGFHAVEVRTLRKRTSKKELYEYLICARRR